MENRAADRRPQIIQRVGNPNRETRRRSVRTRYPSGSAQGQPSKRKKGETFRTRASRANQQVSQPDQRSAKNFCRTRIDSNCAGGFRVRQTMVKIENWLVHAVRRKKLCLAT